MLDRLRFRLLLVEYSLFDLLGYSRGRVLVVQKTISAKMDQFDRYFDSLQKANPDVSRPFLAPDGTIFFYD